MASGHEDLQREIWAAVSCLEGAVSAPQTAYQHLALSEAFDALARATFAQREEIEQTIWAIWCDHPDEIAKAQMAKAIGHLARAELDDSAAVLETLCSRYPDWAEVWNKRATVHFVQGRDAASVGDIRRTLELEPRHFGALGGLSQICLRNGNPDAARVALEALLRVNPGAAGVAELLATLAKDAPRVMH
jgi:Flp pilus assembly protein TadD